MLSLCIPTFRRFNFLKNYIQEYLKNPYIDEIVISDEDGTDNALIQEYFSNNPKIKLYQNEHILGTFANKNKVVSYAKNDWVCLMDSDNFAPIEYFESWVKYIQLHSLNDKTIYMPSRTIPQNNHEGFDFTEFESMILNKDILVVPETFEKYSLVLNVGNYIFNKHNYLESNKFHEEFQSKCDIIDVHFKNILLCKNNSNLVIVPGMCYHHIVHSGSFWLQNCQKFDQGFSLMKQLSSQLND